MRFPAWQCTCMRPWLGVTAPPPCPTHETKLHATLAILTGISLRMTTNSTKVRFA